jgi:CRISPR/Cas system-associated endonuclease Cas1
MNVTGVLTEKSMMRLSHHVIRIGGSVKSNIMFAYHYGSPLGVITPASGGAQCLLLQDSRRRLLLFETVHKQS